MPISSEPAIAVDFWGSTGGNVGSTLTSKICLQSGVAGSSKAIAACCVVLLNSLRFVGAASADSGGVK